MLLQEVYVANAARRHRLEAGTISTVRAVLAPRVRLYIWPEPSTDLAAVLETLPREESFELVREDHEGYITDLRISDEGHLRLPVRLARARGNDTPCDDR